MTHLVNISSTEGKALAVDAADLAIFLDLPDNTKGDDRVHFHFAHYRNERRPNLVFQKKAWEIDTELCARKLAEAGHDFFKMPYIWGDDQYLGEAYINPDAVSAVIVSAPFVPTDGTEPHVGVLIDVNGYGRFESYGVPERLVTQLVDRIKAGRPHTEHVDPATATARWSRPGYVIYDPKQVNGIYQNGYDVDLIFTNGHRIDFSLAGRKIYNDDPQLREAFAAAVAAQGDGLVKLDAESTFYTRLDDVTGIFRFERQLQFEFQNRSDCGPGAAYFKSTEKAQAELERITSLMPSPAP